ncbi:MAG: acetyl-CoA C-acyltransferase [Syntrophomonadaceae bacterium]|jgi:acetyl-CoA C-acetyltransferase|nr:acetyl-CoA C-acyltransferase [Syntrophomonadaceae bacterium]
MQEVVIVAAARTPFGLYKGSLADQRSQDLAAKSMKEAVERSGIDSSEFDASIYSEAVQTSLPANVGRHGWLLAGLDENPAGFTMNTLCAGAIQTMFSAYNKILLGEYQLFLTGGVETSTQAPYYIFHPRYEFGPKSHYFHDQKVEIQTNAQPNDIYGELTLAAIADTVAFNNGLTRLALDEYVLASKEKAAAAAKNGNQKEAVVNFAKKTKKGEVVIDSDEGVKKATTLDKLMGLPSINCCGSASEGNIAPLADGSASIVLASAAKAGGKALAKIAGFGVAAGNPNLVERTAVNSINKALKYSGIALKDVDFIDIHEQSAAFALAVTNLLGPDAAGKINVDGGSLAYGHAGAATGGALVANMAYRLNKTNAKVGVVNVAAFGGQALTVVLKK